MNVFCNLNEYVLYIMPYSKIEDTKNNVEKLCTNDEMQSTPLIRSPVSIQRGQNLSSHARSCIFSNKFSAKTWSIFPYFFSIRIHLKNYSSHYQKF